MLCVAAVAAAAVAIAAAVATPPCSLNGQLRAGSTSDCACDPGWTGTACTNLAVSPSRVLWPQLSDGDPRTIDAPSLSWGGSVLYDAKTRLWHGWFNSGCQTNISFMHTYITGAVHAVAADVKGPYAFADVSVPGELENPMSISDGAGGVLIAYLDHGLPNGSALNMQMPCFGASNGTMRGATPRPAGPYPRRLCATLQSEGQDRNDPNRRDPKIEGRRLGIASAPSPDGPWTYAYPRVIKPGYNASRDHDVECGINPSLFRLANGTWLLATRFDPPHGSHLALATAPSAKGPFTLVAPGGAQWAPGVGTQGAEDPFTWRNKRGFHMLYHMGPHGRHAFSLDGLQWEGYNDFDIIWGFWGVFREACAFFFLQCIHPTQCGVCSTWCPCLLDADWCL